MTLFIDALSCGLLLVAVLALLLQATYVSLKNGAEWRATGRGKTLKFVLILLCATNTTSIVGASPSTALLGSGPINGRVIDAITGKPITGAVVIAEGSTRIAYSSACTNVAWAVTDADGKYSIPWQVAATWKHAITTEGSMTIAAPGYIGDFFALDGTPISWAKFGERADSESRRPNVPSQEQQLIPVVAGKKAFPFNLGPYSCSFEDNNRVGKYLYDVAYRRSCSQDLQAVATDYDLQQIWFYSLRATLSRENREWSNRNKRNRPEVDEQSRRLAEVIGGWPEVESGHWVTPKVVTAEQTRQFCKIVAKAFET